MKQNQRVRFVSSGQSSALAEGVSADQSAPPQQQAAVKRSKRSLLPRNGSSACVQADGDAVFALQSAAARRNRQHFTLGRL